jgi:hypothetical protein
MEAMSWLSSPLAIALSPMCTVVADPIPLRGLVSVAAISLPEC